MAVHYEPTGSPFAEPVVHAIRHDAQTTIACVGHVPDALAISAQALGFSMRNLDPAAFVAGQPFHDALLWIAAADDVTAALPQIAARQREEAIPMVVVTSLDGLDAVIDVTNFDPQIPVLVDPDINEQVRMIARRISQSRVTLHATVADSRTDDIVTLQAEVARISQMLARLSQDDLDLKPAVPSPFIDEQFQSPRRGFIGDDSVRTAPVSVRDVRLVIRQRRMRDELFDAELFADPAWDMLLDLYAARLERHRVSVSSLCIAAAVPATTALRWIKSLTDQGLFERQEDPHDGRRIFVALSDRATAAMQRYFNRLADPRLTV